MIKTGVAIASDEELQWVLAEASRCLFCVDAPCIGGCPVHIDIPQFIRLIRWKDFKGAKETIKIANFMGSICGYLCPAGELCQKDCVLSKTGSPISIAALQRFACDRADYGSEIKTAAGTKKRVAVVGGGPAGLSCALELRGFGHEVDLFEKEKFLAGTVAQEIPEFKIPQHILKKEIGELDLNQIRIHLGIEVDRNLLEREISKQYDAIFLGVGLSRSKPTDLNRKNLKNVFDASQFLNSIKNGAINQLKGICITIGGGDTAVDCARMALRLGAQRSILAYRRSQKEMPAAKAEVRQALEEGVEILWQVTPFRLAGQKKVEAIEFARTKLVSSAQSGRKRFKEVAGAKLKLPVNVVVFALGKDRDDGLGHFLGDRTKTIDLKTLQVGKTKYFVGGDFFNGGETVVEAIADGQRAARSIDHYIRSG